MALIRFCAWLQENYLVSPVNANPMHPFAKIVISALKPLMKAHGFRKKGSRFVHDGEDAILWVEVQGSRDYDLTELKYKFTVNLGAFLPKLAKALGDPIRDCDISNGHWSVRLGHLMPGPADRWWTVSDPIVADEIGKEVAVILLQYGLPALRAAGTIAGLARFYQEGPGAVFGGSRFEEVNAVLQLLRTSSEH